MKKILKIDETDNVAVALEELNKGQELKNIHPNCIKIIEKISQGHKVSLKNISSEEEIIKYGKPIGKANRNIPVGSWVHTHNMETKLKGKIDYEYKPIDFDFPNCNEVPYFKGYRRTDGKVGVRNEIWLISSVGCINKLVERIGLKAKKENKEKFKNNNLDDISILTHPYGCSQLGEDLKNTQKLLSNLVKHPNAGGVLVCGLGCEENTVNKFKDKLSSYDKNRVKFITFQEEVNEMNVALKKINELIDYASTFRKEEISIDKLVLGLKCGGSDSFSGISANPLLGRVSDKLIACGGRTILSEVPEMFGAEQVLMNRATNEEIFNEIVNMINDYKDYYLKHNQNIYENPSPGNIKGGITTLEEKSLGNIEKGGSSEIVEVINYGERINNKKGLHLLHSPGNDIVSTTALVAAGAHIVLFTTGRGTPFGGPVPTVKISSNTNIYRRKPNWIDFNAGGLFEDKTMPELENKLFNFILKLSSGEIRSINEKRGFKEIAIFKTGVTL